MTNCFALFDESFAAAISNVKLACFGECAIRAQLDKSGLLILLTKRTICCRSEGLVR